MFSQLNAGIFIALLACGVVTLINAATVRGVEWKILGVNPRFAYYGGINVSRNALAVFLVSGGIAGLAGAEQVLGVDKACHDNFSPRYGFDGIAVAMLARNSPIGVIFAAFLFGTMNAGSAVLQMTMGVSKYLVQVLHFTIVLVLAAQFSFSWLARWRSPASGESACAKHHGLRPDLLRISTPLIYAALGGLLTYQAGILNIALDGFHDRRGLCRDRRRLRQRKRRARGDRRNRQRHGACRAPRRL